LVANEDATPPAESFNKAERLFAEGLFSDALPIYENFLYSTPLNDESHVRMRLAACYLQQNDPDKALKIVIDTKGGDEKEKACLLAVLYRRLGNHQKALLTLEKLSACPDPAIKLQLGLNSFYLKNPAEAKRYFDSIPLDTSDPTNYWVAQLYLCRLQLAEWKKEAQVHLNNVKFQIPQNHPLHFEISYLEGLTALLQQNPQNAYTNFENSLRIKEPEKSALFTTPARVSAEREAPDETASDKGIAVAISEELDVSDGVFAAGRKLAGVVNKAEKCPWYCDALYQMAQCSLASDHFSVAEMHLKRGWAASNEERFSIALAKFYFTKARVLKDLEAYENGKEWASRLPEHQYDLLIFQAAASPSAEERTKYYQELTDLSQRSQPAYAQAWYAKAISEYEMNSADAVESFQQAYQLSQDKDPATAALALRGQVLAYYSQGNKSSFQQAWALLRRLKEPEELYYVGALLGLSLPTEIPLEQVLQFIEEGATTGIYAEKMIRALGIFYYNRGQFEESSQTWSRLIKMNAQSQYRCEALYWKGRCAENRKDFETMRTLFKEIYETEPETPFAAKAYFHSYSYQDYMQGNKKAIKHLQVMPESFHDHPLLIMAYYLLGLDYKKDRTNDNGRMIKSKNLTAAIDSFEKAETLFDTLSKQQAIPQEELSFYIQVCYRAKFERGQANLAIAQGAQGGKHDIYLSYAKGVFEEIRQDFHAPLPILSEHIFKMNPYPALLEETEFHLALLYLQDAKPAKAQEMFNHMLDHYREVGQTQSYYLSRVWSEKGKLARKGSEFQTALTSFQKAEVSCQQLGAEERLELWIQQSDCLKELGHYGEAMILLSKVVNDESISGLRVKAMLLRAELYQLQGKHELALKQLEAASKKGGIWGKQAKEKMDKDYGYPQ